MEQKDALRLALLERAKEARKSAYCPYSGFAVGAALLCGKRKFSAIAIVGGKVGQEPRELCAPCGVCRQVMAEFCGPEFEILLTQEGNLQVTTLKELLPMAFGPGNLQE